MTITTPDIRPCRSGLHEYDHARYRQCPDCEREYLSSPKGKQAKRKYDRSPKGKQAQKWAKRKYRQTLKGIISNINLTAKRHGYSPITTPEEEILWPRPVCCQCCGRKNRSGDNLSLDHCHKTGDARAWLCKRCNGGNIGHLTHEQALLWVRIMYEGYRPAWTGPGR